MAVSKSATCKYAAPKFPLYPLSSGRKRTAVLNSAMLRCHLQSAKTPAPDCCARRDFPAALSRPGEMPRQLAPLRRCAEATSPGYFQRQGNQAATPHKSAARESRRLFRFCFSELAQNNSARRGRRNSVPPRFSGVARLLQGIFPGSAKRRDENVPAQNWAAAAALRKIPRLRLARQIFAPAPPRDRHAIPPFAAQAQSRAETRL